ncbi:glycosyltransferase family 2 protein [Methylobacterium sp. NEAU 140]|uniref:glycosyltransferase family 2 protein n=1 Tax=Methylobacterium sp. NEAU 140 TaxID=3064945 RepID=UPI0027359DBF|nr:glycosyltransferase family 2 protein [Methylobacterium sp. NEAU 140]MDP4023747.1 glycosyltransferase family 2 protein [Methylobacterium sp. NEAU 140]
MPLLLDLVIVLCVSLTVLLAMPVAVLCIEIAAAWTRRPSPSRSKGAPIDRPPLAVVVPAHDEEQTLGATLRSVHAQMRPADRLVVVAHNCSDRTAEIAARAGCEVVVCVDPGRRGKGYAMDAGIRHLRTAPPKVVVFVDADCRLGDGTLDALAALACARHRPAQALFLSFAPRGAAPALKISEFAYRLKNEIRPRGLAALGLPCQLTGSGMAFPWSVIVVADLASGEIVEDLKLGLDCALIGVPPVLCDEALITTDFPLSRQVATTQRERWQRGHLRQIRWALRPLAFAVSRRDLPLLAQTLDLMVPPVILLALGNAAAVSVGAVAALAGASLVPLAVSATSCACLALAVGAAARLAGRGRETGMSLLAFTAYAAGSVALYPRLMSRARTTWIRTERSGTP